MEAYPVSRAVGDPRAQRAVLTVTDCSVSNTSSASLTLPAVLARSGEYGRSQFAAFQQEAGGLGSAMTGG